MSNDTSGPAFPVEIHNRSDVVVDGFRGDKIHPSEKVFYQGLSVREYAAIKAMQGLLANEAVVGHLTAYAQQQQKSLHDVVSIASVNYADALLAELAKSNQQEQSK